MFAFNAGKDMKHKSIMMKEMSSSISHYMIYQELKINVKQNRVVTT